MTIIFYLFTIVFCSPVKFKFSECDSATSCSERGKLPVCLPWTYGGDPERLSPRGYIMYLRTVLNNPTPYCYTNPSMKEHTISQCHVFSLAILLQNLPSKAEPVSPHTGARSGCVTGMIERLVRAYVLPVLPIATLLILPLRLV